MIVESHSPPPPNILLYEWILIPRRGCVRNLPQKPNTSGATVSDHTVDTYVKHNMMQLLCALAGGVGQR